MSPFGTSSSELSLESFFHFPSRLLNLSVLVIWVHRTAVYLLYFIIFLFFDFIFTLVYFFPLNSFPLISCRDIFPSHVQFFVQNDAVAALASGTMGKLHGCVLIAGTGTIAYGFTEDGRDARAAGAGPVLGDWGRYALHGFTALIVLFLGFKVIFHPSGFFSRISQVHCLL